MPGQVGTGLAGGAGTMPSCKALSRSDLRARRAPNPLIFNELGFCLAIRHNNVRRRSLRKTYP